MFRPNLAIFGGGSLLVAATILMAGSFTVITPPAQAAAGELTCKTSLGSNFSRSSGNASERCCLVSIEQDWYREHGVVLGKVYLTADKRKVRPMLCEGEATTGTTMTQGGDTPGTGGPGDPSSMWSSSSYYEPPQSISSKGKDGGGGGLLCNGGCGNY